MFMKHNENNKVDKIVLFHQVLGKASQPRMNCHGTLQSTDYTMVCRVTNNKGSRTPLDDTVYAKSQLPKGKLQGFLAATAQKRRIRKDRRCLSFPALGEAVTVPSKLAGEVHQPEESRRTPSQAGFPNFCIRGAGGSLPVSQGGPAPPILSPLPKELRHPLLHTPGGKPGPLPKEGDSSPSVWSLSGAHRLPLVLKGAWLHA